MNGIGLAAEIAFVASVLWLGAAPACVGYAIALLISGRRDPTSPGCARCVASASRADLASRSACPRCGATPVVPATLRQPRVLAALRWIVLPIVVWIALLVVPIAFAASRFEAP